MGGERYRYTIVVCPKCGTPKIADLVSKTTRCPSCGRVLTLKKMRHHGGGDTPQSLIPLIAELNRRRGNIHTLFRKERVNIGENGNKEVTEREKNRGGFALETGETERAKVPETEENGERKEVAGTGAEIRKEELKEMAEEEALPENEEVRAEVMETGEKEKVKPEEYSRPRQSGGDRISRLRRRLEDSGEFTVEDFTRIFSELGGKREKAADVLRSFMESGEVYSPKKGVFRFIGGSGD